MTAARSDRRGDSSGYAELADSIADLSALVMSDSALSTTLTHIADFAVKGIPGADGAGVTLFQDDRPDTVVASAQFVRDTDSLQYSIGEGPCITATRERRTVRSDSLAADLAYPEFGPKAAGLGVHSALSLPLVDADSVLGSINVYARAERAFDDQAAHLGGLFAVPVAVSVQNARALSEAQLLAARLRDAMTALAAGTAEADSGRRAAEDDTRRARAQASAATASKEHFLSRVSHEMRTPLNAVLGFAQLLEHDNLSGSQREAVTHILTNSRDLLTMIEDVFDLTDPDPADPLPRHRVGLDQLVDEAIKPELPAAAAAGVTIDRHAHQFDRPPWIDADPHRVHQILTNVLTNAVKFNHRGGRVDVWCAVATRPDPPEVTVTVTDTGSGIAAADHRRLFTPFDRLGRTSATAGSGLGLAVSHRLAMLMGGRLEVVSTAGRGTTVTLTLPLAPEPDPAAGGAVHTLLYIDVARVNAALLAGILRRRPRWTSVHADDAAAGLDLARTARPDLIVLRPDPADPAGAAAIETFAADVLTRDVPIAILGEDDERAVAGSGRAVHRLAEPVDVPTVLDLLDDVARTAFGPLAEGRAAIRPRE